MCARLTGSCGECRENHRAALNDQFARLHQVCDGAVDGLERKGFDLRVDNVAQALIPKLQGKLAETE